MDHLPVIIRLLDPPLHEFLPDYESLVKIVAKLEASGDEHSVELEAKRSLLSDVEALHESNPMMGLRGVRLGIVTPQLLRMQLRALFEAACAVQKAGVQVFPKIMIPLTSTWKELRAVKPIVQEVAAAVFLEQGVTVKYMFGTMIETPRAALTAGELAEYAEFFSFGTNDLTQMTWGISRDDAEREFLLQYMAADIVPANPFQTIDPQGVGRLVELAVREGRGVRSDLSVGICGEHGGEPKSIAICHKHGLHYVSCSPFRVPVARLAAAHAALNS
eukprot:c10331_g1_i1.p1 GENE.c10331_g1_i1~~c10331_g1_i1.p1  ORF type:complete len:275 (+),score=76.62 c10331_g1_i1:180-1004(+)